MSSTSYTAKIEPLNTTPGTHRRRAGVVTALLVVGGLVAVGWVAKVAVERSELDRADLRLAAESRSVEQSFGAIVSRADADAGTLASSRRLQRALARGDRAGVRGIVRGRSAAVYRGRRLLAGSVPPGSVTRSVFVTVGGKPLGRVVRYVTLDSALLQRLAAGAGLRRGDTLFLAQSGPRLRVGHAADRRFDGKLYRTYGVQLVSGVHPAAVAVATERAAITRNVRHRALWAIVAAMTTLATVALGAYVVVSARRRRLAAAADARQARGLSLVGDALASTHNPERLLPVVLHTAMQTTGATGGRIVHGDSEVAREGELDDEAEPLRLDLTHGEDGAEETALLLYPSARGFDERTTSLAHSLASQASIALENARLHRIVERQAVTDELTGLANRRAFMEALGRELRRADRFGGSVALVFADLDDFKRVNDRFGHSVGDELLRTFAEILQGRTREIDVCARLGGEEFAILLAETTIAGAESLAESLRIAVANLKVPAGPDNTVTVTASFGVAAFPETHTADDLMTAADLALYSAKRQGKNRVVSVARADS